VAQGAEHQPNKCSSLSSNTSIAKKKQQLQKNEQKEFKNNPATIVAKACVR
jgi:hypothetical protein